MFLELVHSHEALHAGPNFRSQRHWRCVDPIKPRVAFCLGRSRPLGGIEGEEALDEGLGLPGDRPPLVVGELELAAVDLLEDRGVVVAVEWGIAAQ